MQHASPPPGHGPHSLSQQLDRFLDGDQAAGFEIYARYEQRLVALATRGIGRPLRSKVQPESVAVTVFRSVFQGLAEGKYVLPENGSLWGLMRKLTQRKILDRVERFRALKRDHRHEVRHGVSGPLTELAAPSPMPDEVAAFADQLQTIRSRMKPESFAVLERALDGYSTTEIAQQMGVTRWTVRRRLDRIQALFADLFDGGSTESPEMP